MMKKIINRIYIHVFTLCSLVSLCYHANAQKEILAAVSPEKIDVHFAKQFFITGETLWFKIYISDAVSGRPSLISKIAYVELLDTANKPVVQTKVFIDSSSGSGSFIIPPYLTTANYTFRAYTSNARNFGPAGFFHQEIAIFNPSKAINSIETNAALSYRVRTAVEGKILAAGVDNTFLFEVTDQYGRPVKTSGKLLNQNTEVISAISTDEKGIGRSVIKPQGNQQYFVSFDSPDGKNVRSNLPVAVNNGYVASLTTEANGKIRVRIQTTDANNNNTVQYYWRNGALKLMHGSVTIKNGVAEMLTDEKELADGLNILRVMNEQQELSELLYIKKANANDIVKIDLGKMVFKQREKIDVKLSGKSSLADISIAVMLVDSLEPALSSGNVPGNIEQIVLARNPADKDPVQQTYIPEYAGHVITGKVIDTKTGQPAAGIITYLSVPGERFQFSNSKSDAAGTIRFDVKKFFGTDNIIVQTGAADSGYRIMITNPFSEVYGSRSSGRLLISPEWQQYLLTRINAAQLQNAFGQQRKEQFYLPDFYDTTSFFGKPDKVYMLDDYTRFTTMEEVLREYVSELKLSKTGSNFRLRTLNAPYKAYFEENPLVLLDGVPVFNVNKIVEFDPLKVKRLDLMTRRYFHAGIYYDGIASFTSYSGDLAGYQLEPNALVIDYPGLQLQRQFISPGYESDSASQSRIPDMRTILYWNPDIRIRKTAPLDLSFYTSDIPGTYAIVIEGITDDGLKIRSIKRIEIKK